MKLLNAVDTYGVDVSHPSRGAWIEMRGLVAVTTPRQSHPSRGAWIEITSVARGTSAKVGRTPHGVRGLKFDTVVAQMPTVQVAPLTGCVD